jgi:DMSO/TMAO reductase YedYZ molybdopterin-dependent catalytic subunit
MTTEPWSVEIDGMVDNPGTYSLEDIVAGQTIEERIYRLRCVERWSMVIPWNGFELADLLERVGVQERRALRRVRDVGPPRGDAGPARADHRVAVSRGSASG